MIQIKKEGKVRQRFSRTLLQMIVPIIGALLFIHIMTTGLFAQDGYDIYYDSIEQWLIMAFSEYNSSTGKYDVYLQVMDSEGNIVSPEDIKGLDSNPYLVAENAVTPMVCLAFDSDSGTAYIAYAGATGIMPPIKLLDILQPLMPLSRFF